MTAVRESARRRISFVFREAVRDEIANRIGVAYDEALEAPLLAQHVTKKKGVASRGHIVQVHVGRHGAADTCVDGCLKRRKVDVVKLSVRYISRVVVAAAGCRAITGEVFHAREQPARTRWVLSLETTHLCSGDPCAEEWIFARTLDDAAPTRITRDVQHRRERPANAGCARLARRDCLHALDEVQIP